jgi:hypothetical protein
MPTRQEGAAASTAALLLVVILAFRWHAYRQRLFYFASRVPHPPRDCAHFGFPPTRGDLASDAEHLAVAPRGAPHAFRVLSTVARLLCLHTQAPARRSTGTPANRSPPTSPATRIVDFARVQVSAEQNGGIDILGHPHSPTTERSWTVASSSRTRSRTEGQPASRRRWRSSGSARQ